MATVFVGNLASDVDENDLRTVFEAFGKIDSLRLISRRGMAFIELEADAANDAVEKLRGEQLKGRTLDVALDRGRPGGGKGGNRRRKGRR